MIDSRADDNLLTVDVEDWRQSTLDHDLPISSRAADNTRRFLDIADGAGARGTFFFLGLVAEKYPELVRETVERGHEAATHGTSHRPVVELGPSRFREDLRRSIRTIEDAGGSRVLGYRAPDFSIGEEALWALEILAEEGLQYDSSIFPFRGPRYGIEGAFAQPHLVRCRANPSFREFPLATVTLFGRRFPVAGGGYFRLLPYALTRAALRRARASGGPVTCYFHPYELDTEEMLRPSLPVPILLRLKQGLGRRWVAGRLKRLMQDFSWAPARDFLSSENLFRGRTLHLPDAGSAAARWEFS